MSLKGTLDYPTGKGSAVLGCAVRGIVVFGVWCLVSGNSLFGMFIVFIAISQCKMLLKNQRNSII